MRKPVPLGAKFIVLLRQAYCAECNEPIGNAQVEFDHRPPLADRPYDVVSGEYDPPANDPKFLQALHVDCHKLKSFGSAVTSVGSDAHRRAKVRRINRVWQAHQAAMQNKGEVKQREETKRPKRKWRNKPIKEVVES